MLLYNPDSVHDEANKLSSQSTGQLAARISSGPTPVLVARKFAARHGPIKVVFDVELDLHAGEILVVLGPNGAGKSSLLGAIAGVVHGDGDLKVNGLALARFPAHLRALKGISFVPEQRRNIFTSMRVAENLDLGLRLTPVERRDSVKKDILELFPILNERMETAAGMLSGGEQQMLAIGMALGREPAVLIMDEPSQGLAPTVFDVLEAAFNTLKQRDIAILLAEQNLPFASRVADRYLILSHGEKVASGGKNELQRHDEIMAHFIGEQASS